MHSRSNVRSKSLYSIRDSPLAFPPTTQSLQQSFSNANNVAVPENVSEATVALNNITGSSDATSTSAKPKVATFKSVQLQVDYLTSTLNIVMILVILLSVPLLFHWSKWTSAVSISNHDWPMLLALLGLFYFIFIQQQQIFSLQNCLASLPPGALQNSKNSISGDNKTNATSPKTPSSSPASPSRSLDFIPNAVEEQRILTSHFRHYFTSDRDQCWVERRRRANVVAFQRIDSEFPETKMPNGVICFKVQTVMEGTVEKLQDLVFPKPEESFKMKWWSKDLTEGYVVKQFDPSAINNVFEALRISYKRHKLPMISDRDWVVLESKHSFEAPPPTVECELSQVKTKACVVSVRSIEDSCAPFATCVRGTIVTSAFFLHALPDDNEHVLATLVVATDPKGRIGLIPQSIITTANMDALIDSLNELQQAVRKPPTN